MNPAPSLYSFIINIDIKNILNRETALNKGEGAG